MDSRAGGRSLSAYNAVLSRPSVGRPEHTAQAPRAVGDPGELSGSPTSSGRPDHRPSRPSYPTGAKHSAKPRPMSPPLAEMALSCIFE